MHAFDRGAHRRHHQSADDSDQRREDDEAGFVGANERPQPAGASRKRDLVTILIEPVYGRKKPPAFV